MKTERKNRFNERRKCSNIIICLVTLYTFSYLKQHLPADYFSIHAIKYKVNLQENGQLWFHYVPTENKTEKETQ